MKDSLLDTKRTEKFFAEDELSLKLLLTSSLELLTHVIWLLRASSGSP